MVQIILDLKIVLFIILSISLGILYFYFQYNKAQENLRYRIKMLKGNSLADQENFSLRQEVWLSRFLVSGLKDFLRQTSTEAARRYRLQFEQAGWNPQDAPLITATANIGFFILGVISFVVLITTVDRFSEAHFLIQLIFLLIILLLSLRSFGFFINYMIHRRQDKIRMGLSYAIDLMSICSRSGYGLEKSFEKIAEEMAKYNQALCQEFAKTAIELSLLPDRNTALRNLAQRINLPIVQMLVSGLVQANEQGAPLGDTLRIMSIEFSKQKMYEIDAKAARMPALLSLPLILFLLPAILVIVLGPAVSNLTKSGYL